jgi:hypothetical protein
MGRWLCVTGWAAGALLTVFGLVLQPHHCWIHYLGELVALLNIGVMVVLLNRDLSLMLPLLHGSCGPTGARFPIQDLRRRWRYPLTLVTIGIAVAFQVGMVFSGTKAGTPLSLVNDGLVFIALASVTSFVPLVRRVRRALRSLDSLVSAGELTAGPPKTAKFILLLVPKRYREHLVGDLEEEYLTIVLPEYGSQKARFWYWLQVVFSIAPIVWSRLKGIVGAAWLWKRVR